jgi:hypothetical protein
VQHTKHNCCSRSVGGGVVVVVVVVAVAVAVNVTGAGARGTAAAASLPPLSRSLRVRTHPSNIRPPSSLVDVLASIHDNTLQTAAHAFLRWNTCQELGDLSESCRGLAVVSVKLMQQQKKVVHHRRPQPYVVKLQSSSFQMRLRPGGSHKKHAERLKGAGQGTF